MPRDGYDFSMALVDQQGKLEVRVLPAGFDPNAYVDIEGCQSAQLTPGERQTQEINMLVGRSTVITLAAQPSTGSLEFYKAPELAAQRILKKSHDDEDQITLQFKEFGERVTPSAGITLTSDISFQIDADGKVDKTEFIAALRQYDIDWNGVILHHEPTSGTDEFFEVERGVSDSGNNLESIQIAGSPDTDTGLPSTTAGTSFLFKYDRNDSTVAAYPASPLTSGALHIYKRLDLITTAGVQVLGDPTYPNFSATAGAQGTNFSTTTVNLSVTGQVRLQYALPTAA